MDSINTNQTEDNFKNIFGSEAIQKIKDLASKSGGCFFCTDIETGKPFATRPMAPERIDEEGNFWFLSASDSHKNEELKQDSHAQLLFQGSSYSDFMSLYGTVEISKDRQKIEELWDAQMKAWFTEGKDDPRITVLQFKPTEGYYWDTKHNMAVAFAKRLIGAAIGKTIDDSIEGNIKL
ncbi:pyridoxamine 5'-phosphate oxidase family protein [Flavobacterium silvaticum]|uniref:Pyridoxamine 5'-phosphate oxidase family protein n=1 Tax=Flavobacterium silvaticum TaxID=1852020 RepID=A0A972FSU5_9FLAO|nr:pyridoxamine 5'-phosphate oxidase family protein [Flavobacterium silvaticum]NMH27367.1 pyridoxamine 5'-phosphate oxidase family protein [Flavobacterium silvaticum]